MINGSNYLQNQLNLGDLLPTWIKINITKMNLMEFIEKEKCQDNKVLWVNTLIVNRVKDRLFKSKGQMITNFITNHKGYVNK